MFVHEKKGSAEVFENLARCKCSDKKNLIILKESHNIKKFLYFKFMQISQ